MDPRHPASVNDMMAAIVTATNKHFDLTRNAAMGQGFDRHLFALRTLAEEEDDDLPAIFTDHSYQHMGHIILSTSTLSTDSVLIGGFAPVSHDGYGIGYNVFPESLGCNITTYPARDGDQFMSCLHQTLDHLHSLMTGHNFK
jgi:carnitine O-palmitoyltransferase 2